MQHDENLKIYHQTLQEDTKLNFSSNEERELRLKYPFANVFIDFPTTGDSLSFPAYLKTLQDSFTPSFTSIDVFGRVDQIPVYQNTRRALSFSLSMPSYNETHAREILKNINTIVKNLYPSYVTPEAQGASSTRIINSPPLIRVKFANLICAYVNPSRGLLGYLNGSINIDHGLDSSGMFIVEQGGNGVIYAKTYEISFNMNVLHEGTPGFDERGEGQFIDGQEFPYQIDPSLPNLINQQSEGALDPETVARVVSRQATNVARGAATELVSKANKMLGGSI